MGAVPILISSGEDLWGRRGIGMQRSYHGIDELLIAAEWTIATSALPPPDSENRHKLGQSRGRVPPLAEPKKTHDSLFKHVFSSTEHAVAILRIILPQGLAKQIDWSSMQLCSGSHVDTLLSDSHSDLLFSARVSGKAGAALPLVRASEPPR